MLISLHGALPRHFVLFVRSFCANWIMSSHGSSSSTSASIELSRFVNGPSFIGRELARRVVMMATRPGPGSDDAAENDAWSGVVMSLLGHPCSVRFFRWVESTYVPHYLSSAHSDLSNQTQWTGWLWTRETKEWRERTQGCSTWQCQEQPPSGIPTTTTSTRKGAVGTQQFTSPGTT